MTTATLERRLAYAEGVIDRTTAAPPAWSSPVALAADLAIALDAWQRLVLESVARRLILLGPRQIGKSTVSGLLGLYVALTTAEALVLLIAPAQDQSKELARTIRGMAARAGLATTERTEQIAPTQLSASRIEFANGSRVIALPGASEATVRGYAKPDVIVVDEAARLKEETFTAIRPMLATHPTGRLLLLSTPWVKSGTFHRTWTSDSPAWERIRVRTDDCPRLTPEYLATEREELPTWVYAREYLGEFSDDDATLFPDELVAAAIDPTVRPLFPLEATGGQIGGPVS
jgi:hypothetical protein